MTQFISIPLKKSAEVDMGGPLRSFIASTYSTTDNPTDAGAIDEFNRLRSRACCQPLDKHESSLEVLYRYYDQLVAIEGKLPLTQTDIPLPFKWKEPFERGIFGKASLTICSGSYEKACVLFNIAALQSQIASSQRCETDEELKLTAKMFQVHCSNKSGDILPKKTNKNFFICAKVMPDELSAGILLHLKDSVLSMVQQEPTVDLLPDTLNALYLLMLAQAQESVYLKAAKDHKPSLRLKVAQECAEMYEDALRSLDRDSLKGLFEREWLPIVSGKQRAFQALAQYDQSLLHKENKEIGPELARLQHANQLMQQAQQCFNSVHRPLYRTEAGIIQKALEAAKKDNDFIYHERVPDVKSLAALPKFAVAHAIPPASPMSTRFKDIFSKLMPVSVQQAVAAFDTRRAAVISSEVARIRENTCLLNGMLASLNLPTAIDDFCRPEALPESIRERSKTVKAAGGISTLSAGISELPTLLQRNQEILGETIRLLNEEKSCDDHLRQQFKEKWTRMASEKLTEPLWQEVKKYQQILDTAANADNILRNKLATHQQGIDLLSKSETELTTAIPGLQKNAVEKHCPAALKLQELMKQVTELKEERERLEAEVKETAFDMTSVFLKALSESGAIKEEEISTEKLNESYSPLRTRISDSIKRQEKIMEQVQQANNQFVQEKGAGSGLSRENMLKELVTAFDAFCELQENLKEGTKFYNDLTPLLLRLQQKVSDFCFARKTEKDDLMKDMQLNIVGQASSQPPAAPKYQEQKEATDNIKTLSYIPPRPPPPRFSALEQPKVIYYQGNAMPEQASNVAPQTAQPAYVPQQGQTPGAPQCFVQQYTPYPFAPQQFVHPYVAPAGTQYGGTAPPYPAYSYPSQATTSPPYPSNFQAMPQPQPYQNQGFTSRNPYQ